MMKTEYYLILKDLPSELDWELREWWIISYSWNMFYAKSISEAIKNNFQQLSPFSTDIVMAYIKRNNWWVKRV